MLALSAADNSTDTLPHTSCCVKQNQNRGNGNGHVNFCTSTECRNTGHTMVIIYMDPVIHATKMKYAEDFITAWEFLQGI
jgi:NADH:ubiquinone oxidoreductase subunit E